MVNIKPCFLNIYVRNADLLSVMGLGRGYVIYARGFHTRCIHRMPPRETWITCLYFVLVRFYEENMNFLHPRRPRGNITGRGDTKYAQQKLEPWKFLKRTERDLRTESLHTISKWLCECWLLIGQKNSFVFSSSHSAKSNFRVSFVCSYTRLL